MSNTIKNEIKGYISSSGWTITEIVNKMNENLPDDKNTTVQNISNKLTRGTIKYSEVKEIADILPCAENTVKTRLHRARKMLQERLANSEWEVLVDDSF